MPGKSKYELLVANLTSEALPDQLLKIRLVVNGEDLGRTAHRRVSPAGRTIVVAGFSEN